MTLMTPRLLSLPLALAALACAKEVPTWGEVRPPEAYVETLPPGATVEVNGKEAGSAPLTIPVRDAKLVYRLHVTAPGFDPLEVAVEGAKLANGRLDLVLRPEGFGKQRRLEPAEPVGLAQAATALVKAGRAHEALSFAEASLAIAETPLAHRAAGDAYRLLGDRNRAVQEYSVYLTLQPEAPDRMAVEREIEAARGDLTIPGPKPE